MSNEGFTLLWSRILDSTVWMEEAETRLVWITMLAMRDADGKVMAAPSALAHRARVSDAGCKKALEIFQAPDPESSTPDEEGRRIRPIPGGWQIINHEKYRFSTEAKREFWREQKREQREAAMKKAAGKSKAIMAGKGTMAERLAVQAEKEGDEETLRRLEEMNGKVVNGSEKAFLEKVQKAMAEAAEAEKKALEDARAAALAAGRGGVVEQGALGGGSAPVLDPEPGGAVLEGIEPVDPGRAEGIDPGETFPEV